MRELCRGPITSDCLGAGWQALSGSLSTRTRRFARHSWVAAPSARGFSVLLSLFPGCGLQAPPDFRAAPSLLRLTALGAFARPYIGLAGCDPVPDPSPLTSDSARRADVAGITDALDPNTLHGEQTPASACSDAVRSDLAAAGAKMAAFAEMKVRRCLWCGDVDGCG